jgi:CDP-glucose 4,6-dehydratase
VSGLKTRKLAHAVGGDPSLLVSIDLKPVIRNIASSEIREQYLDAGKVRQLLGWKPRHDMQQAIEETVAWYREHLASQ